MRIAIPVTNGKIPNHLGHCQQFLIADVEDGKIVQEVVAPNPGHGPGGPPPMFLMNLRVQQVLAWGMPAHAAGMFAQGGVKVQLGVIGEPRKALEDFLTGTLTLTTDRLDAGGGCNHDHDHDHDHDH